MPPEDPSNPDSPAAPNLFDRVDGGQVEAAKAEMVAAYAADDQARIVAAREKLESLEAHGLLGNPQPLMHSPISREAQAEIDAHQARATRQAIEMNVPASTDVYVLPVEAADRIAPDNGALLATRGAALQGQVTPKQWATLATAFVAEALRAPAAEPTRTAADDADPRLQFYTPEARATLTAQQARALVQSLEMGFGDSLEDYGIPPSISHLVPADDPTLRAARAAARDAGITPDQWRGLVRQFFAASLRTMPHGR